VSFGLPLALLGLIAVPVLVALYVLRERRREGFAARWGTPALLPNLVTHAPGLRRHLPVAVLLVALASLVVGVARPHAVVSVPREEATVLLAIDISRSMSATDVLPSRLGAAQIAANDFVDKVPKKYRIGVISFATRAQVAVAPTDDRDLVHAAIASLRPGEGTAIGDAVLLAAMLGRRQRGSDGSLPPTSVLLISDGARDGGRTAPRAAAQRARALRTPVYTILLGTPNGVVQHQLPGGFTETIRVPPSPPTLQLIARTSGGQFFRARSDKRLREVYDQLRSRIGHKRVTREITDFFAGGGALLLLGGGTLSAFWFRRVP
jgi:Ca-activated chloride channel family protein